MKLEHKRDAALRMKTIQGHLQAVVDMIDGDQYCVDVMKQIAAVQSSLERVNRLLLQNHLETCVTESIQAGGGQHKIDELMEALKFTSSLTDFRHLEHLGRKSTSNSSKLRRKANA